MRERLARLHQASRNLAARAGESYSQSSWNSSFQQIRPNAFQVVGQQLSQTDALLVRQVLRPLEQTPALVLQQWLAAFAKHAPRLTGVVDDHEIVQRLVQFGHHLEAVQDGQRLGARLGDDFQVGPPPVRADELDLVGDLLADKGKGLLEAELRPVLAHPQQPDAIGLDLVPAVAEQHGQRAPARVDQARSAVTLHVSFVRSNVSFHAAYPAVNCGFQVEGFHGPSSWKRHLDLPLRAAACFDHVPSAVTTGLSSSTPADSQHPGDLARQCKGSISVSSFLSSPPTSPLSCAAQRASGQTSTPLRDRARHQLHKSFLRARRLINASRPRWRCG